MFEDRRYREIGREWQRRRRRGMKNNTLTPK